MDDEEYFELARLIRNHLLDLDLDDIADFSNYTDDEGDERSLPDGRTLMKLMLASFDRYLAANAAETVEESLRIIASNIDEGAPPSRRLSTSATIGLPPWKIERSRQRSSGWATWRRCGKR